MCCCALAPHVPHAYLTRHSPLGPLANRRREQEPQLQLALCEFAAVRGSLTPARLVLLCMPSLVTRAAQMVFAGLSDFTWAALSYKNVHERVLFREHARKSNSVSGVVFGDNSKAGPHARSFERRHVKHVHAPPADRLQMHGIE